MVNRITRRMNRLERIRASGYPCPGCGWPHGEKTLRFIDPGQVTNLAMASSRVLHAIETVL